MNRHICRYTTPHTHTHVCLIKAKTFTGAAWGFRAATAHLGTVELLWVKVKSSARHWKVSVPPSFFYFFFFLLFGLLLNFLLLYLLKAFTKKKKFFHNENHSSFSGATLIKTCISSEAHDHFSIFSDETPVLWLATDTKPFPYSTLFNLISDSSYNYFLCFCNFLLLFLIPFCVGADHMPCLWGIHYFCGDLWAWLPLPESFMLGFSISPHFALKWFIIGIVFTNHFCSNCKAK